MTTKIEVCSTFNLAYNDVIYASNEVIEIPDNDTTLDYSTTPERKKINNKVYNANSNTYENIIFNKKEIAINLFDKLDKEILNISATIIRNYLVKSVVYKLKNRFLEIVINQSNLLICFHKDIKQYDSKNLLKVRKGYENDTITYCINIDDESYIEYIIILINKYYVYYTSPKESLEEKLFDKLKFNIQMLAENISTHITNKGLMFKTKRNFVLISKKTYGVYVKILNVDNKDDTLEVVTRKNYEPLCLCYKVKNEDDINIVMPYIKASLDISEYNPSDLKHNFLKYYYKEN